ncbi:MULTISPECIES: hypothetical protein [unclassified Nonomuraea]
MPRHLFEPGVQEWVRFQRMDIVLDTVRWAAATTKTCAWPPSIS